MKLQTKVILFSTMLLTGTYLGGKANEPVQAAENNIIETTANNASSIKSEDNQSSDFSSANSNSEASGESSEQSSSSDSSEKTSSDESTKDTEQNSESDKLYEHNHMTKTSVVKKGDNVTFIVDYQFSNTSKEFKKLVLTDPLETPFRYKSSKVMTADEKGEKFKDITDLGKTNFDKGGNILTFAFTNPNNYWGQKVRWQIETTLDKNADISKYMNSDGKIEIPNVASYDTGTESKTSDPVKVTPPKDKVTPPSKADPLPEPDPLPDTGRETQTYRGIFASIKALASGVVDWVVGK